MGKLPAEFRGIRKRIEGLFDREEISQDDFRALMTEARFTQAGIMMLKPKIGESYRDLLVRSYDEVFCRAILHDWQRIPFSLSYKPVAATRTETYRCDRCTSQRTDIINALGRVDRVERKNPDGWHVPGGGTLTKTDWKAVLRYLELEQFISSLEFQTEAPSNVVNLRGSA